MSKRVALATILGALAFFTWGALSHMVFMIGDSGLEPIRAEDQALLDAIQEATPQPGIYLYPMMAEGTDRDDAAMRAWVERTKTEPHGLIVVNHHEYPGMNRQLVQELGIDLVMALVASMLLSRIGATGYVRRVALVAVLGIPAALRPLQQWNWFEFPSGYTMAQVADGVLAFLAMGLVIAAIVKPAPRA